MDCDGSTRKHPATGVTGQPFSGGRRYEESITRNENGQEYIPYPSANFLKKRFVVLIYSIDMWHTMVYIIEYELLERPVTKTRRWQMPQIDNTGKRIVSFYLGQEAGTFHKKFEEFWKQMMVEAADRVEPPYNDEKLAAEIGASVVRVRAWLKKPPLSVDGDKWFKNMLKKKVNEKAKALPATIGSGTMEEESAQA